MEVLNSEQKQEQSGKWKHEERGLRVSQRRPYKNERINEI